MSESVTSPGGRPPAPPAGFSVRLKVRHYELDTLGHLNHAVYHQYAEVARLEWFESVGLPPGGGDAAASPVMLETRVRFRRELRAGDEVDVSCEVSFTEGKTFRMDSQIRKLDGTVAAEIEGVFGVMDLSARKLVASPRDALQAVGLRV